MKRKFEVGRVDVTAGGLVPRILVHELGASWSFAFTIPWAMLADHKVYDEMMRAIDAWQRWEFTKAGPPDTPMF